MDDSFLLHCRLERRKDITETIMLIVWALGVIISILSCFSYGGIWLIQ